MEAILKFNLNDFDDIKAHMRCVLATEMALVLWELVHNTKKNLEGKIERALEEDKNFTPYDSLDIIYDEVHELLAEHSINIDSLIV